MAFCPQGILGPFSKKIGPVVGCICKNRSNYVRSYPLSYNDAKTPAQLLNRAKMRETMAFVSKAKRFVGFTFGEMAKNQTACNIATKLNFHKVRVVSSGGREMTNQHRHDGMVEVRLEYDQLRLSHGDIMPLDSALMLRVDGTLMLRWKSLICTEKSQPTDKLHLFVYNESRNDEVTRLCVATRGEEEHLVTLPKRWGEDRLHVYAVVSDTREVEFSDTMYFEVDGAEKTKEKGVVKGTMAKDAGEPINLLKNNRFAGRRVSDSKNNSLAYAANQTALRMLIGQGYGGVGNGDAEPGIGGGVGEKAGPPSR